MFSKILLLRSLQTEIVIGIGSDLGVSGLEKHPDGLSGSSIMAGDSYKEK